MAGLRVLDVRRLTGGRKHSHPLLRSGGSPAGINTSHSHLATYTGWGFTSMGGFPKTLVFISPQTTAVKVFVVCLFFLTVWDCMSPFLSK